MTNTDPNGLHVSPRPELGKKTSKIRKMGLVPGNIFGEEKQSESISIGKSDLIRFLKSEGDSGLIYLIVGDDKKKVPTLIEEIQYNVVNEEPLHISFKRVNLKEKVVQEVPVEMIGEADIPGATILLTKDVLEVEALPADLPESIVLDISVLKEIDQALHLSDAQYDRSKVTVLLSEEELESPLVLVQKHEEEVAEEPTEATEGAEAPAVEEEKSESEEPATE